MRHTASTTADHGPPIEIARNGLGAVELCACGTLTLHVQHLSLRIDGNAFRALAQLVDSARQRLDHPDAVVALHLSPPAGAALQ